MSKRFSFGNMDETEIFPEKNDKEMSRKRKLSEHRKPVRITPLPQKKCFLVRWWEWVQSRSFF